MSRKSNFRLYRVWDGIVQRCCNPKAKNFYNYGGRGICLYDAWRDNFAAFEKFCLANGWEYGLQVDRIDNDRGYFPDNIRFVTRAKNLRNKRTNHMIAFMGETLCVTDWCERFGISDSTLWRRLKSGWSIEDSLTKPRQKRTKKMDMDGMEKMDGGGEDG